MSPTYAVFTPADPTTAVFWIMYAQMGDFRVSRGPPTVPLMPRRGPSVVDKSNFWPHCVLVRKMLKDHCKTMDTDTRTEIHINIVGGNEMSFHLFWPGAQ